MWDETLERAALDVKRRMANELDRVRKEISDKYGLPDHCFVIEGGGFERSAGSGVQVGAQLCPKYVGDTDTLLRWLAKYKGASDELDDLKEKLRARCERAEEEMPEERDEEHPDGGTVCYDGARVNLNEFRRLAGLDPIRQEDD